MLRWLGDTIQNSSDVAVYLSYLRQGADGHVLLKNLFATEPHAARFDLVWSLLGLVARTGIPIVAVHELARVVFALLLLFAITAGARSLTTRHARLATVLAVGGVGFGWLYSIWLGAENLWRPGLYAAADVVTEFSVAPTLLGGAHMILSIALLLTGLRLLWNGWMESRRRDVAAALGCFAILFAFHPYFVPLYAVFAVLMLLRRKKSAVRHWILVLPLIPAAFVYVPLAFDPVFRTHHLVVNVLPLAPLGSWIATLLPFACAICWRWRRGVRITDRERWLLAWIASALICLILPLPWRRKYTEGLGVALVFLTLPAWIAIRDWIATRRPRFVARLTGGALLLAACLTPLHLLASQIAWMNGPPAKNHYFFQPQAVFDAWAFLHDRTPTSSNVISDDSWVNVWTSAYAGRTVWVAHDHETPDFDRKRAAWERFLATTDAAEARKILDDAGVTHFIATSAASKERFARLTGWNVVFEKDDVTVFARYYSVNP